MQSEFGLQMRTPTDDANEGIIYQPQDTSVVAPNQGNTKQLTRDGQLDESVKTFGDSFGKALDQFVVRDHEMKQAQRAQQAVIRQSLGNTTNEIDAEAKRTGWTEAFAGQSVQYRDAQLQANKNRIMQGELDARQNMWKKAHLTPDMYLQERQAGLEELLKPYAKDQAAREALSIAYIDSSNRLAQDQYKDHYAWSQTQMYNETVNVLTSQVDLTNQMNQNQADPEKVKQSWDGVIYGKLLHQGELTPDGQRRAWQEVMNKSLRNGNIILYRELKARGELGDMTDKEQETLQSSIEQFDTQQDYKIRTVVDHLRYLSEAPIAVKDQWVEYEKSLKELQAMRPYISESLKSVAQLEKGIADLLKMKPLVQKKAAQGAALDDALWNAKNGRSIVDQPIADLKTFPVGKGGTNRILSTEERRKSFSNDATREIAASIGITDETQIRNLPSEVQVERLLRDPTLAPNITRLVSHTGHVIDQFAALANNFVAGFETAANAGDRQANEDFTAVYNTLKSIQDTDVDYFEKVMGANAGKFEIISMGIEGGKTPDLIKQQFDNATLLNNTDGVAPIPTNGKTQSEYLKTVFAEELGENATAADLNKAATWYKEGMSYWGNDTVATEKWVKNRLRSYTTKVFGKRVPNGKFLETLAPQGENNIPFSDVLEHVSQPDVGIAKLAIQRLQRPSDDGSVKQTDLRLLPGLQITPDPRADGFWLDAEGSPNGRILIDRATFNSWYRDAKLRMERDKLISEKRHEQQMMRIPLGL